MAPIFASADIAALVSAFEPPLPTKQHPTLVSRRSGDGLYQSQHVLTRFRTLLETSSSRIKLQDLPTRLDIGTADWVLKCYDRPLYYGRDSQTLLPDAEISAPLSQLKSRLQSSILEIGELVSAINIDERSLDNLIEISTTGEHLRHFQDEGNGRRYVYTDAGSENTVKDIRDRLARSSDIRVNLSESFASIPIALLEAFAEKAVAGISTDGSFETIGGDMFFVPSTYVNTVKEQQQAVREGELDARIRQLNEDGFCRIHNVSSAQSWSVEDVRNRYQKSYGESNSIVEITTPGEKTAISLVVAARLEQAVDYITQVIPEVASDVWRSRHGSESAASIRATVVDKARIASSSHELVSLVLQSIRCIEIENAIGSAFADLEATDSSSYSTMMSERLLAPLQLYADGLSVVTGDATLSQHLSDFLIDHFRFELWPPVFSALNDQRLLVDRDRKKEVEKIQQSIREAKSFPDMHTATLKIARRQKIEAPSAALSQSVKRQTLQQRAKAVRSMKRGSDLLQNLLWILLSGQHEGLFVSSGKDTSRMIKLYASVGDAESTKQLEAWRDMLKAGNEDKAELDAMRELALKCVQDVLERPTIAPGAS